jgi:hypothetical protein
MELTSITEVDTGVNKDGGNHQQENQEAAEAETKSIAGILASSLCSWLLYLMLRRF